MSFFWKKVVKERDEVKDELSESSDKELGGEGGEAAQSKKQEIAEEKCKTEISNLFSSPYLVYLTFLSRTGSGFDFSVTEKTYNTIISHGSESLTKILSDSCHTMLDCISQNLDSHQNEVEILQHAILPVLIVLQNPILMEPEHHPLLLHANEIMVRLSRDSHGALIKEIDRFPRERMEATVTLFQQLLVVGYYQSMSVNEQVNKAAQGLALFFESNEGVPRVPLDVFYSDIVNDDEFDLKKEYLMWHRSESSSLCRHPFLFDAERKSHILVMDTHMQKSHQVHEAIFSSLRSGIMYPYNVMSVRRESIIADTILQIQRNKSELKKPLKVRFVGEFGVDEGGVQKEFFQLIVREIFDPKYGMFEYNPDTRLFWFGTSPLDMASEYELVGMVIGLAIFNGHILDFRFPNVLYKKLLGKPTNFDDLVEIDPSLASGLKCLLDFEGDVQETFMRNFQVSVKDMFGSTQTVDLKEGGENIPLTSENRQEYVDLCIDYYLNRSIEKNFKNFGEGFHFLCGGRVIKMFQPQELELLVCGNPVFDFDELEKSTIYQDGYTRKSPVIEFFWKIVHGFTEEQKKKLLFFVSGSDRVPIGGLAAFSLVICKNGDDSDRLPTSHTCFNHLLLPEYRDFDKMKERLLLAINNSEGFGLM